MRDTGTKILIRLPSAPARLLQSLLAESDCQMPGSPATWSRIERGPAAADLLSLPIWRIRAASRSSQKIALEAAARAVFLEAPDLAIHVCMLLLLVHHSLVQEQLASRQTWKRNRSGQTCNVGHHVLVARYGSVSGLLQICKMARRAHCHAAASCSSSLVYPWAQKSRPEQPFISGLASSTRMPGPCLWAATRACPRGTSEAPPQPSEAFCLGPGKGRVSSSPVFSVLIQPQMAV